MSAEEIKCRVCDRTLPRFPKGRSGKPVSGSEVGQWMRLLHMKKEHPEAEEWKEIWQDVRYLVKLAGGKPAEAEKVLSPD
ncbi:MAG: hypothetical protein HYY99_01785 [Candidatus Colwellbacteria bacterium]|nr:hypothetical protein [Candidatus Colwellbacteria bacterium]